MHLPQKVKRPSLPEPARAARPALSVRLKTQGTADTSPLVQRLRHQWFIVNH